jgi:peptidoglycan/LPS O-acetylase OafA/YrhL
MNLGHANVFIEYPTVHFMAGRQQVTTQTGSERLNDRPELHPTPVSRHRFHFLDGMRGLAAILVLFWHTPADLHFHAGHSTYLAVDFFFCLSGFVIAFSYETRLRQTFGLKRFTVARLIRLYPTYLLGIVLGAFSRIALHDTRMGAAQFLLLFCIQLLILPPLRLWPGSSLFPLDDPAWSMFLELIANLAYGWAVVKRFSTNRNLATVCLFSVLVLAFWLAHGGTIDVGNRAIWNSLLGIVRVTVSFVGGVLMLRLFRRRAMTPWSGRRAGITGAAIALITVLLLLQPFKPIQSEFFSLCTIAIFFPGLIYLGAFCNVSAGWTRICSLFGDLSYPLYLLHIPLQSFVYTQTLLHAALLRPTLRVSLPVGVVLIASAISYIAFRYYDAPVRSFLTRRYNAHLERSASLI